MSWASRCSAVNIGDRVSYSASFLRSIGCFTGDMPLARGVVTGLTAIGEEIALADIEWDVEGLPERVNGKNLTRVTERGILE